MNHGQGPAAMPGARPAQETPGSPEAQVLILNVDDNDGARYAKSRVDSP
jgi:hypothetical protein